MGGRSGRALWEGVVGGCCGRALWEDVVGGRCGRMLWEDVAGVHCKARENCRLYEGEKPLHPITNPHIRNNNSDQRRFQRISFNKYL